jgi:isopropylmalate/homocitrate/citramalate synthase
MAKIRLGARPKTFARKITVPLPEGGEGSIEVQYVYRTRTEFAEFVGDITKAAGTAPPVDTTAEAVDESIRRAMEATLSANADYIMRIATGWDLEHEFTRQNVVQLCDELPGAALAMMSQYREAITEGRLGN